MGISMIKSKNRKLLFGVILVLITALSFSKVLDDYTDTYTSDAIVNAAITYATARGINAAVSIMQTTTLGFSLGVSGSLTIGQILDPINDLIERFSSVMIVVLASLAGQKILLYVSSHIVFQILVAIFGGLTILSIYGVRLLPASPLFKSFLVLVFMRFSLGFVVALNSGVDRMFLFEQYSHYESEVETINQNLPNAEEIVNNEIDLDKFKQQVSESIDSFINLMVLYLMKSIIFPILFFYAFIVVIKKIWSIDIPIGEQQETVKV